MWDAKQRKRQIAFIYALGDATSSSSTVSFSSHPPLALLPASSVSSEETPYASPTSKPTTLTVAELIAQFPSLAEPFARAPIVGLYFCASWCDDCWKATPIVEKVISNQTCDDNHESDSDDTCVVEVVYVSSDATAEDMAAYRPRVFSEIPFENELERANLKRHFGVCAKKEMDALDMSDSDRKHGTPTFILLESSTGRILTEYGVSNCMKGGSAQDVLAGWRRMVLDQEDEEDLSETIQGLLATTKSNAAKKIINGSKNNNNTNSNSGATTTETVVSAQKGLRNLGFNNRSRSSRGVEV